MTSTYWKAVLAFGVFVIGFGLAWGIQADRINSIKADYQQAVADAKEANRETEKLMQDNADAITVKYNKEKRDAEKTITDLRRRIADGTVRLSVSTEGTSGVSTGASAESREGRAYVDRGIAQRLVSITERGDRAIRRLNECIDRYEALRQ